MPSGLRLVDDRCHFSIAQICAQHALHARVAGAAYYFYPERPSRPPLTVFA
jgi:hypothetical protein